VALRHEGDAAPDVLGDGRRAGVGAVDVDLALLRPKLNELGVPNLWIPRKVYRIESIPVLASGKLDLRKCKELAESVSPTNPSQ